ESRTRVLDYIPMFWFLGLYEILNPEGTLIPAAHLWAVRAVAAMFVVSAVFAVSYLISYRRHSKKILEGIESDIFREPWHGRVVASVLNHTLLRHPFQRGSFYFIGRIFRRSPKHRLFIAMYGGIGIAVVMSSLFVLRRDVDFVLSISRNGLMEAPLILSFFVVSGLRATFNIPYELGANWMFQITSGKHAAEFLKATVRGVILHGVLPVYIVLAAFEFAFLDVYEAVFQLAFGLLIAALLTEVLFFKFNKVPFTCSYLPAKSHLAFLAGAYLYGFTMYTFTMASLESWVQGSAERIILFFALAGVSLVALSWYRSVRQDRTVEIIYEDDRDPLVRQLNLG